MKEGIKVSEHEASLIEAKTRKQSSSEEWKLQRQSRLTASNFGAICKSTDDRDMEIFCKSMHSPPNLIHVPAIRHGCTYESVALKKFSEMTGKTILPSGFCILPRLPFLGATPDGVVQDEDAVIEVKCPFEGRSSKVNPGKNFTFLERVGSNGPIRLKRTHNYYYQLVGQMMLSRKNVGYFVVFTHQDLFYEKIELDKDFFNNAMLPKLKDFYDNIYCPYVASVMKKKFLRDCTCEKP